MSADEFLDGDFLDDESHDENDSLSQDEGDSDLDDNLVYKICCINLLSPF